MLGKSPNVRPGAAVLVAPPTTPRSKRPAFDHDSPAPPTKRIRTSDISTLSLPQEASPRTPCKRLQPIVIDSDDDMPLSQPRPRKATSASVDASPRVGTPVRIAIPTNVPRSGPRPVQSMKRPFYQQHEYRPHCSPSGVAHRSPLQGRQSIAVEIVHSKRPIPLPNPTSPCPAPSSIHANPVGPATSRHAAPASIHAPTTTTAATRSRPAASATPVKKVRTPTVRASPLALPARPTGRPSTARGLAKGSVVEVASPTPNAKAPTVRASPRTGGGKSAAKGLGTHTVTEAASPSPKPKPSVLPLKSRPKPKPTSAAKQPPEHSASRTLTLAPEPMPFNSNQSALLPMDADVASPIPTLFTPADITLREPLPHDFDAARYAITSRLTERAPFASLIGLDEQYGKVYDLLERTARFGESNSLVVVGAPGSGKSAMVRKALCDLTATFPAVDPRPSSTSKPFLEINLSGYLQTDDRLALKEIVRQLQRQQIGERDPETVEEIASGSFADCLLYVLETLRTGSVKSTPVVFILDDVDLFAGHPKQALLYNLLDVCQTSQNPVAVLGITSRIDFVDLLEKRVKSRFSHRQVCVYPPDSVADFTAIIREALVLGSGDGVLDPAYIRAFNSRVDATLAAGRYGDMIKSVFEISKDVRRVMREMYAAVVELTCQQAYLDMDDASSPPSSVVPTSGSPNAPSIPSPRTPGGRRPPPPPPRTQRVRSSDPKVLTVASLSILELILLVCMVQHHRRQVEAFNFEMVYDEYRDLIVRIGRTGKGGDMFFVKGVAVKAFERLESLELCRAVVDGGGGKGPKEHRMVRLVVGEREVEKGVEDFDGGCPDVIRKWAIGR
ncbi:origin recognition complex subunit 4 [Thoreauomyces humboldtii]|nr:origin recognition complex subunit 4 [Thoreauomyces humboldtii]